MNLVMLAYIGGGLLVCSYLCWRFPGIRAVLRTWCLILARPLARLTQIATLLTSWCHQVFLKGMSLPQTDDRDNEQIFAKILVRLFHMGIGLVIILAEVPLTSYRSAAFYNLIETKLNLPLSLFTALLWTLLPGVWLYTLADVTILPQWACLFPFVHTHKVARWCIGFVALVLFGASAYLSYPFYQWSQCSILSLTCASDPTIQMFTIPLFGVLLSLAGSVVCLWAILLGVITVVSCMFGLVGLFFLACAYLVFGLAGDTLTSISQPQYIPSYTPVNLPLTAPESYAALPMHTAGNGSGPTEEELLMNNAQRTIAIVGYGPAGYRLVPLFGETGIAMTVTAILLAFGVVDLSRLHREDTPLSIPGVTSISPSLAERTKAHADELLVSAYTKLANSMHQKLIDLFTAKHGGTILAIVDMTVLHEVAESLRSLMKRLPKQDMVIICPILPSDMHKTHLINEVYALLAQLQAEGVCSISLIYDPLRAPLAMHWGTDILEKALVQTMLSLCIAPMIDDSNPTISEVFNRLGAQSPFCGLSYSSAGVASGATPWLWKAWQKVAPGAGARGRGSIDDLFIQARECINRTQQDQKSLASPAMPDEDQLRFAVLNLPFAAGDTRFTEAAHSLQTYIKHTFHNSMFDVVVRSNGVAATANSVHTSSYYVGASCLYGLPLVSVIPTDDQAVTSSDNEQTGNTTLTTVVLETPVSERVNGRKRS